MITQSPRGAVLFADICDSVRLYEQHGSARGMQIAEQSMAHMIRTTEEFEGIVIRPQGDGVKSLFPTVDSAFDAAAEMQSCHRGGPCCIKVAFCFGEIMHAQDDVFGDTVHLAARLLGLARPGEILIPGCTVTQLSVDRRLNTRLLDTTQLKGMSSPVEVFTVVNADEDDSPHSKTIITMSAVAQSITPPNNLVLMYPGGRILYDDTSEALTIGRSDECDVVINSNYASRLHAKIELKRNYFLLTDQSTNGTYVTNQDNKSVFLKRESVQLVGHGMISLGRPASHTPEGVLRFFHDNAV